MALRETYIKSKRRASSDAAQKNKEKETIITYY